MKQITHSIVALKKPKQLNEEADTRSNILVP